MLRCNQSTDLSVHYVAHPVIDVLVELGFADIEEAHVYLLADLGLASAKQTSHLIVPS